MVEECRADGVCARLAGPADAGALKGRERLARLDGLGSSGRQAIAVALRVIDPLDGELLRLREELVAFAKKQRAAARVRHRPAHCGGARPVHGIVATVEIRARDPADIPEVAAFLERHHSLRVARLDRLERPLEYPALLAVDERRIVGVLTYVLGGPTAEILTLHVEGQWRGVGTSLIRAVERVATKARCTRLFLITTNDNVDALRFYQRRGFRLVQVRPGAVDRSRTTIKPEIPLVGSYGIALRDELILEKALPATDGGPSIVDTGQ